MHKVMSWLALSAGLTAVWAGATTFPEAVLAQSHLSPLQQTFGDNRQIGRAHV